MQASDEMEIYARILDIAGLTDELRTGGPYTVFLPAGFLADELLFATYNDPEALANVMLAHVVEGDLKSGDLIDADSLVTLAGNEIPVIVGEDDIIYVGAAGVLDVNIPATNGTIHILGDIIDPTLDFEDYDLFDDVNPDASEVDSDVTDDLEESLDEMEEEEGEEESSD